ncbi:beta-ketoacyl synthase N-terminal-like domain-containing protein [Zobellia galactanivorans]|uniref:3-oxoacyl-[acyl-carrier-protein] synthase II n=1 Tax=Zobellia galactanivorans (strain DSM 12802 / CCUG 47099 / CIP 106680 / NCIMB 13871 / Dsij) TaxID=63186 RepID=G0L5E3_ZOBGA|nr:MULTISPECIES: beta-ketoacyl synthase N-terminal-like domain-containing protein [Zobellia]MBU3026421.1 beta-ketoacyl synthase chain length factor [Zobellia galactanivorans]MDO6810046.1 beta-ketoacyl synthase N-terminal-like domain-containing protein [Zobellia galactanivorans]OWW27092.1 3-oxoacyl-ACP synthase [Zobellia sp. OII3]CAZ96207.1 3-oxoacyl-[acyl-carrier-protein] synthase II [Zobellia galactanivorans]
MKPVYINSVGSVSAQKTFDNSEFLNEITEYNASTVPVIDPNYKEYIPPAAARRMARGIKMSTVSSKNALNEAGIENIDAIIVGTGLGCIGDSERFVSDIIKNDEQFLTPTRFIQSSHNTVAGQIALGLGCKGHNFTFVHSAVSFESSLIDAKMMIENDEAETVLVGGVDELVDHHVETHRLIGHIKKEPVASQELLQSKTEGMVMGEGAHFFVLSNQKAPSCYAELLAVKTFNTLSKERLEEKVLAFLERQQLNIDDIDLAILGNNGDVNFDTYYDQLGSSLLKDTPQAYYKHLSGEFDTATGFAFWLANKIIKTQTVPEVVQLNAIVPAKLETILIYNQYRGENHSLTLIRKC